MCATLYRINWDRPLLKSGYVFAGAFTAAPVEFAMWSRRQIKSMLECLSQRIPVAFNHGGR
jgi:hypothetical protein